MSDKEAPRVRLLNLLKNWRLYAYGFIPFYALLGIVSGISSDREQWLAELPRVLFDVAIFNVLTPLALIWFMEYFSAPLQDGTGEADPCGDDAKAKPLSTQDYLILKQRWMVFAYGFMIFSMAMAIYPFMIDQIPKQSDKSNYARYVERRTDAPISVLRGCVVDDKDPASTLLCRPEGSKIESPRLNWLIQVGGQVIPLDDWERHCQAQANAQPQSAASAREPAAQPSESNPQALNQASPGAPAPSAGCPATRDISSSLSTHGSFVVRGGLVIPLYLVVFSLVGGAISLTRRIPEYQKQSDPWYTSVEGAPRLTRTMLREFLVFQIVQFVSAPFIAVIAYYVIRPGTTEAAVALAFGSGFASETVLLWVRAAFDKVTPKPVADSSTGSLVGLVTDKDGHVVEKAKISLASTPPRTAETDQSGCFLLDGVAVGDWAVEATDTDGRQKTLAKVRVEANKATFLPIGLSEDAAESQPAGESGAATEVPSTAP